MTVRDDEDEDAAKDADDGTVGGRGESRAERKRRELAAQTEEDAAFLLGFAAAERPARAALKGWPEARTKRALQVARLSDPAPDPVPERPTNVVKLVPRAEVKLVPRPPEDDRPEIRITANTHEVTDAMVGALRDEPGLYHRDHTLVHVVVSDEVKKGEIVLVTKGTPQTRDLQLSTLIDLVSKRAVCMSWDARIERYVHKAPPKDRVRAVLERGQWPGLPELVGVLEAPSMRPDGSLIQTPGYDPATRFLYAPSEPFERVPDLPTIDQARAALAELLEVYCDFPYVDEAHRSAALALPVTLLARPAIDGPVPCWLKDASVKRSGKTKSTDAASIIATGRVAGRSIFPSSKNVDELAKVMAGHAQAGTPLIFFDNVPQSQAFAGPVLDAWITAEGRTNFRVLGKTGDHQVEWRSVIVASGNGIQVGEDLAPRCLAPRLESPLENPELRADFKHDPLLPWVKENRARLVVAILTLLRAYDVAGRPDMKIARWGGFEAWTDLVASALVWAGAADPTKARKSTSAADDPQLAAERVLVASWHFVCNEAGKDSMTAAQFIAAVYAHRKAQAENGPPELDVGPVREAVEFLTRTKPGTAPDSKRLGHVLRGLKHRNVQGRKLVADGETHGLVRWTTVGS